MTTTNVIFHQLYPALSDNPAVSTAANSILTSSSMASAASTLAAVAATNNSSSSSSVITSQSNSTDLFGSGGKGFNLDPEDQFRCGKSEKFKENRGYVHTVSDTCCTANSTFNEIRNDLLNFRSNSIATLRAKAQEHSVRNLFSPATSFSQHQMQQMHHQMMQHHQQQLHQQQQQQQLHHQEVQVGAQNFRFRGIIIVGDLFYRATYVAF